MTRDCTTTRLETLERETALERLRRYGIEEQKIYFIDLVPLIEMVWAEGRIGYDQLTFLYDFTKRHVKHINDVTGYAVLNKDDAIAFAKPLLAVHPDMTILKKIRECIVPVRLGEARNDYGDMIMSRIMSACRELLSRAMAEHPAGLHDLYCRNEIEMYLDITRTFSVYDGKVLYWALPTRGGSPAEEHPERRAAYVGNNTLPY
jgi:hypothetical protein